MGNSSTSDPFKKELGKALRAARQSKGLSQSYVAQELYGTDATANYIGRYENAHRTPNVETLASLSVIYETPMDDLTRNAIKAAQQIKKGSHGKREKEEE